MKTFLLSLFMGSLIFSVPAIDDDVEIQEWVVPWDNTRPRDPYVAPDGMVWFCGQRGDYIASLDPSTGEFERYEIPENSHPHNLIVDADGMVWYAGNTAAFIGKLDPSTGETIRFEMPEAGARDPHTLVFDRAGDIWFTVQGGNYIGKLDTQSGEVKLVAVTASRSRPYGIKVDPENRPWIALFGTNKIATVDPVTLELEEIELPRSETRPRRLEVTDDGMIWYVDYAAGFLGRLNPETREVSEWKMPGGDSSRPYGTAKDDQNRIWFVETGSQPNKFVGFDPATEEFFSNTAVPSGGGTVRYMYFHPQTKEIWFGADSNTIGRAKLSSESSL